MNALDALFSSLAIIFVATMILTVLFPAGLAYIALRVRDQRNTRPDKWLGLKTAFHLVHSIAVLMLLIGLSVSAADLMQGQLGGQPRNQQPAPQPNLFGGGGRAPLPPPPKDEFWTTAQRTAVALTASGFLFAVIFWGLLVTGTNDRRYTTVWRTFVGGRLAVGLLVVFAAVTTLGVILAQKDPKMEPVEMLSGVLIVWVPASAVHLFLFHQAARLPTEPAMAPEADDLAEAAES